MSEETVLPVSVPISSTLDPAGLNAVVGKLQEAVTKLHETKEAAHGAKEGTDSLGEAAKHLGAQLAAMFGVLEIIHKIWEQVKEGVHEVAAMEQTMISLEATTKRLGLPLGETREKIEAMSLAMLKNAGIDDDKTIPAMVKLLDLTNDMNKVMTLSQLAGDLSVKKTIDIGEAYNLVTAAAQGRTKALRNIITGIDESLPKEERARQALQLISEQTHGAMENAHGLTIEWHRLVEEWGNARAEAVEGLMPVLTKIVNVFRQIGAGLGNAGDQIKIFFQAFMAQAKVTSDFFWDLVLGQGPSIKKALTDYLKIFEDWSAKRVALDAELKTKLAAIQTGAHVKTGHEDDDARKASMAREKAAAEEAKKLYEEVLQARIASLKAQEAAAKDHEQKLHVGLQALDLEEKLAVSKADGNAQKIHAIHEEYAAKRLKLVQDVSKEIVKAEGVEIKDAEAIEKKKQEAIKRTEELRRGLADARMKNEHDADLKKMRQIEAIGAWEREQMTHLLGTDKQIQEQTVLIHKQAIEQIAAVEEAHAELQREQAKELQNTMFAVLGAIFGESKALAVAQAVMNTAESITKTFAQLGWPAGIAGAAIAAALGFVQVQKIMSTQPAGGGSGSTSGKGFDDPYNDQMAILGGRGWARDFVHLVTGSFRDELANSARQMRTQNSYVTHNTNNLHLHNVSFLDPSNQRSVGTLMDTMQVVQQMRMRRVTGSALR